MNIAELWAGDKRSNALHNIYSAGVWTVVTHVDSGQVGLTDPTFDSKQSLALVPFMHATGGTPVKGDSAFLHYDREGTPAYAVVWG